MAQVEIISELQENKGWMFEVQVLNDAGALSRHRLTLSWADYNLWSPDGADEPERVAEAVVLYLRSRMSAEELGARFDASIARRKFPSADMEIPQMIRR